ncbi:MAG: 1-acyl-sn-glycerol-3-phosphate acyltransferase [Anaerolineae bacterium]|nr:1-acyl-sn-glycerol-3-phosphate acyltransferase [Anaerolineae bacterium]
MTESLPVKTNKPDWRDQTTWPLHSTPTYKVNETVVRAFVALFTRFEAIGTENIPAGACIVAPNHSSNYDPMFVGVGTYPRQLFFMGKQELYKNPVAAWYFRQCGTFPVNRGMRDQWALRHAGRVLEAGRLLCMFPEGTRSKTAQLAKGKIGTVKLALEHNAPIVPVAIIGSRAVKVGLKRTPVKVIFDKPLYLQKEAGVPPYEYQTIRDLTHDLMQRIAVMLPPENRGFYA